MSKYMLSENRKGDPKVALTFAHYISVVLIRKSKNKPWIRKFFDVGLENKSQTKTTTLASLNTSKMQKIGPVCLDTCVFSKCSVIFRFSARVGF